jgi:predicted RNase H-like HicB family nuclease
MTHYVAIIEDAGSDKAVGIWFPDLPGCFSAGDDIDSALLTASEALFLLPNLRQRTADLFLPRVPLTH